MFGIIPMTAGLLGIVFGLIGRSQSKRRGQKGRVMGTWGAVLGATWLTIIVVVAVRDGLAAAERDNNGKVMKPGHELPFSLQVGDCLRAAPSDMTVVVDVDLVPCAGAHGAEVFAGVDLTYASYPGNVVISDRSESFCKKEFKAFVGLSYNDSVLDVYYLFPTARSWSVGDDRAVLCLVGGPDLVGTARGAHR